MNGRSSKQLRKIFSVDGEMPAPMRRSYRRAKKALARLPEKSKGDFVSGLAKLVVLRETIAQKKKTLDALTSKSSAVDKAEEGQGSPRLGR